MKFDKTEVFGFSAAFRGLRNPKNSWHLSDSHDCNEMCDDCTKCDDLVALVGHPFIIGAKDMKLAQTLIKAGPEHRKFLRYIHVQADITAPLYWYKEYDTYKIATVANSTSTMHKITSQPITLDCFETDDLSDSIIAGDDHGTYYIQIKNHYLKEINFLEELRQKYLETKDVRYWKELIRWLPESWLQTRTVDLNYETLRAMYFQRRNHKLTEWHTFCKWVESLPYAPELICLEG